MANMKPEFLALTLLCCVTSVAGQDESFVCITDKVTGFNYNDSTGGWDTSAFLPGERFRISALGIDSYKIEKLDEFQDWTAACQRRNDLDEDSFTCETGTNAVHFNRKELRFTAFRYFGFWNGSKDSMSISIGSCTAA
jgi:hypothetical protein